MKVSSDVAIDVLWRVAAGSPRFRPAANAKHGVEPAF
jgi:hypothetical protein